MKVRDLVSILEEIPEKKLKIFEILDTFIVKGELDHDKAIEQADIVAAAAEEADIYIDHVRGFARTLDDKSY